MLSVYYGRKSKLLELPAALLASLKRIAERECRSTNAQIVYVLEKHVAEEEAK